MAERSAIPNPESARTVVLTGATGFVGQHLQARLIQAGFRVRALVRPGAQRSGQIRSGCEVAAGHLHDVEFLDPAVADADAVIYCAGSVRGRAPADFRPANVAGVQHVADAIRRSGRASPLLLVSSLAASRPQISDYALTKHEGEQVLHAFRDMCWTILRPPALYGPGDREMLPILQWLRRGIAPVPGPVDQRLSLLHVDDFAGAALAWLGASESCRHGTYEIHDGTVRGYDWAEMGRAVAQRNVRLLPVPGALLRTAGQLNRLLSLAFGYAPMLTPGKVRELRQPHWLGDNQAFHAATGWSPGIDLRKGAAALFETQRPA